jgi:hypothetical protein
MYILLHVLLMGIVEIEIVMDSGFALSYRTKALYS